MEKNVDSTVNNGPNLQSIFTSPHPKKAKLKVRDLLEREKE